MFFYYKNQLTPAEQVAFTEIAVAATELRPKVSLSGICTFEQARRVLFAVTRDIPSLFFVKSASRLIKRGSHVDVFLEYEYPREIIVRDLKRINNIADYLTVVCAGKTDEDTLAFMHDYLVRNLTYGKPDERDDSGAYRVDGALLNHQCVCAGYAHAFKLLCDRCGIDCIYVSGHSGENHSNHGWNIVKVDSKWYHVDVTFDHVLYENVVSKKHFLISTEELLENHSFRNSTFVLPACPESRCPLKRVSSPEEIAREAALAAEKGRRATEYRLMLPMSRRELEDRVMRALSGFAVVSGNSVSFCYSCEDRVSTIAIIINP